MLVWSCAPASREMSTARRGEVVHNRLRKWMNETGIPASQRDQLPLLAAGSEVLWVCGAGFAEGLAPDADTAQVLQMEMEHREEIT